MFQGSKADKCKPLCAGLTVLLACSPLISELPQYKPGLELSMFIRDFTILMYCEILDKHGKVHSQTLETCLAPTHHVLLQVISVQLQMHECLLQILILVLCVSMYVSESVCVKLALSGYLSGCLCLFKVHECIIKYTYIYLAVTKLPKVSHDFLVYSALLVRQQILPGESQVVLEMCIHAIAMGDDLWWMIYVYFCVSCRWVNKLQVSDGRC